MERENADDWTDHQPSSDITAAEHSVQVAGKQSKGKRLWRQNLIFRLCGEKNLSSAAMKMYRLELSTNIFDMLGYH